MCALFLFLARKMKKFMENTLIGREEEKRILQQAMESREAEMVAVFGRRRVGKTFLVKSVYREQIVFEITGIQNAPYAEQMQNFAQQLNKAANNVVPVQTPANWLEAFFLLTQLLEQKAGDQKQVVFFDELPWLAARKSGFLRAFGNFWNSWAVNQHIVVVICGSAASWMIQKVVHDTGGLYNRITRRIHLQAFTLAETEQFLQSRHVHLDRYQIVQLHMAMGGIPHYLKEVETGNSATQNINRICFSPNGLLREEFPQLYAALFVNASNHMAVIRALAARRQGLLRKQIAEISQVPNGGGLTKVLEELVQSDFIAVFRPFGKKKQEQLYRLTDAYSLFYLQFMENRPYEGADTWQLLSQTQAYKTWSGYAFENVCFRHIPQIKKALGISGVFSNTSSFYRKGTPEEEGAQIDLLIDRNDHVVNLCEIKYYQEPFALTKAQADNLRNKMGVFRQATKTPKHLAIVLITTFGVKTNQYSLGLNVQSLTLEALFG